MVRMMTKIKGLLNCNSRVIYITPSYIYMYAIVIHNWECIWVKFKSTDYTTQRDHYDVYGTNP